MSTNNLLSNWCFLIRNSFSYMFSIHHIHNIYIFNFLYSIYKMDLNPLHAFLSKPKCPSCGTPINWGSTTFFDKKLNAEFCLICNALLKKD